MKKFQFSLDTVLDYKQQVLDSRQGEYGIAAAAVHVQERVLEQANQRYAEYGAEYSRRQAEGMTIADALAGQNALRAMENEIARAQIRLNDLRKEAEAKRAQMVEAKKETATIEKLREKKLDIYKKEQQKREEAFIDELVSTNRVMAASNM